MGFSSVCYFIVILNLPSTKCSSPFLFLRYRMKLKTITFRTPEIRPNRREHHNSLYLKISEIPCESFEHEMHRIRCISYSNNYYCTPAICRFNPTKQARANYSMKQIRLFLCQIIWMNSLARKMCIFLIIVYAVI